MALTSPPRGVSPGDLLLVVRKSFFFFLSLRRSQPIPRSSGPPSLCSGTAPDRVDDFDARGSDELTLRRGEKIELVELDDGFGDGWYLGKELKGDTVGLFPGGMKLPLPPLEENAAKVKLAHPT